MTANLRTICLCPKCDKKCMKTLLKHNCWSAIVLGVLMLTLGIVLRSAIVYKSSPTVTSSGMLFIMIGVFIILMGPFAAIYELMSNRNTTNRSGEAQVESSSSPRPSDASDPPSYGQVMTAMKTPSATYNMQFYPQVLSLEKLSEDNKPSPPSYEEVVVNSGENRRMTVY